MSSLMYLEDFKPGQIIEVPGRTVTEEEIIRFASEFDPQPFHLDKEAAKDHMFGGLVASGWHTAAIMMRALVDGYISKSASLGSPGVDELRWHKPVRPGDCLSVRIEILEVTPSKSKPHLGILRNKIEVLNQNNDVVLSTLGMGMFGRRPDEVTS
ncbi:MAG: MaoC family dehydratase [Alphaproteobacteria bacterium]|nr:MaoC family dehydratase [Rhodospirillales bacterium]MCW9045436.1 MaoC family dehydratase [Alphaproteobacteria bacterium]